MLPLPLAAIIKDLLIITASLILLISILRIRKLKKSLALQIQTRLIPHVTLEIDEKELVIFIKNESFFLARDIQIENTELVLDDHGFRLNLILKFQSIETLKAQEKIQLKFKAFDKQDNFLPDATERLIPHLINATFKVRIQLSNIENMKFFITLSRKERRFTLEKIETFP